MPNGERPTLRLDIIEEPLVSDFRGLLEALERLYNGVLTFETVIDAYTARTRSFYEAFGRPEGDQRPMWFPGIFGFERPLDPYFLTSRDLSTLVLPDDRLILRGAEFASPGFIEVLGSLNPLEVIRNYLQDRHRRRQDLEYREEAERRRLDLDNVILETEAIRGRIDLARELGATNDQLAPLINVLVSNPARELGAFQDRGMIEPPTNEAESSE
jgi:hypothetical protein